MDTILGAALHSAVPFDATQAIAADIDDSNGIEALRAAWGTRRDGFRALYLEHGAIGNETDARVASALAASLRAPITAPVVGHFRREIGMKAYERRARPGDMTALPPPTELPFERQHHHNAPSSDEVFLAGAVLADLCKGVRIPMSDDPGADGLAKHVGEFAAKIGRAAAAMLREARS